MFDEFQGGKVGRRCSVTVIANLDNLDRVGCAYSRCRMGVV